MSWRDLRLVTDASVPKLNNLRRAAEAGIATSDTRWIPAAEWADATPRVRAGLVSEALATLGFPCIVRSGSPTEDTAETSHAGQLLSLVVDRGASFAEAVNRVVATLPRDAAGPRGVVFVQRVVEAVEAGVTFFDGFYFEETSTAGGNTSLTSGRDRGTVVRGHLMRGDERHRWLKKLGRAFPGNIDVEWGRPATGGRILLQCRPALFPIRRNETLSLANHKEILGDPPSPWMVGLLAAAARPVMGYFEAVEPAMKGWDEPYAVILAERAWLNFSAFYRLMDAWGLPRSMVTAGVGGEGGGAADGWLVWGTFVRAIPRLIRLSINNLRAIAGIGRGLRKLDAELDAAATLAEVFEVNARALEFSIRTNFAIVGSLSILSSVRKKLGLDRAGRLVTQEMMGGYAELSSRQAVADRLAGLDAWLARYGHRGPLESDPCQPRFAELRPALAADLERGATPSGGSHRRSSGIIAFLARPLFLLDEVRERFRDRLMRWWQRLRGKILGLAARAVASGFLDDPADVFDLRGDDLAADPTTWRARAAANRHAREIAARLNLPTTATRDEIVSAVAAVEPGAPAGDRFEGIGLGSTKVRGIAVRASSVVELLAGPPIAPGSILVAPTLEPSWAIVFPRFAGVVAELGGELSHAAILLREAGIPAVVNARGAFAVIRDGETLDLDPARGRVSILSGDDAPKQDSVPPS